MEQKNSDSFTEILERSKTATPYQPGEYDGEEDLARIVATLEAHAQKLKNENHTE